MTEIMSTLEIFSGYTETELDTLEKFFKIEKYDAGVPVIKPGDPVKKLFIVLSGKITGTLKLPGSIDRKHVEY